MKTNVKTFRFLPAQFFETFLRQHFVTPCQLALITRARKVKLFPRVRIESTISMVTSKQLFY